MALYLTFSVERQQLGAVWQIAKMSTSNEHVCLSCKERRSKWPLTTCCRFIHRIDWPLSMGYHDWLNSRPYLTHSRPRSVAQWANEDQISRMKNHLSSYIAVWCIDSRDNQELAGIHWPTIHLSWTGSLTTPVWAWFKSLVRHVDRQVWTTGRPSHNMIAGFGATDRPARPQYHMLTEVSWMWSPFLDQMPARSQCDHQTLWSSGLGHWLARPQYHCGRIITWFWRKGQSSWAKRISTWRTCTSPMRTKSINKTHLGL
jgi:hypothetical protein